MKLYLAPLEGITTNIYRNAVNEMFGGIDKYFTPFFSPQTKRHPSSYAMLGILPERNKNLYLVPQMLTDDAEDFLEWEKDMRAYGYEELNLNTGCPSGTVVSKGRGAGFLRYPEKLDHFLEDVFSKTNSKISVKTRLGMHDPEEFYSLLEIFNKYPLEELIIHARVREEIYKGEVHKDVYEWAKNNSKNKLVYNGDVFTKEEMPDGEDAVMLGRGMVANPALACGRVASNQEKYEFLTRLIRDYIDRDPDEKHCMEKLKEICSYMQAPKQVMKAKRLEEFKVELNKFLK